MTFCPLSFFQRLVPERILDRAKNLFGSRLLPTAPEWQLVKGGWPDSFLNTDQSRWNSTEVRATHRARWNEFCSRIEGVGPVGVPYEFTVARDDDLSSHNNFMSFLVVLSRVAARRNELSVLDWGGSLGHYSRVIQSFLPHLAVDYTVCEVEALAREGSIVNSAVHFVTDATALTSRYDLVVASSSLHYEREWKERLKALVRLSRGYLYLARIPLIARGETVLLRQKVAAYGFGDDLVGWCFNRGSLLGEFDALGLSLVREFITDQPLSILDVGEPVHSRAFLLRIGS